MDVDPSDNSGQISETDKDQTDASVQKRVLVAQSVEFSGPLPHPKILAEYEQINPGFADRIFKMAEAEQSHRHQSQSRILKDLSGDLKVQHYLNSIGLFTGTFIIALGILAAAYMATHGAQTSAGIMVTALVSLALIFVLRRKPKAEPGSQSHAELKKEK